MTACDDERLMSLLGRASLNPSDCEWQKKHMLNIICWLKRETNVVVASFNLRMQEEADSIP